MNSHRSRNSQSSLMNLVASPRAREGFMCLAGFMIATLIFMQPISGYKGTRSWFQAGFVCNQHTKVDTSNTKSPTNDLVLVTGSAGFIGSHVARHALSFGLRVVCLDDLSGGFIDNVPKDCIFEKGDLTDEVFIDGLFKKYGGFKYIYHLGAYAAEGLSHFIRVYNYDTNLVATTRLINYAVNYNTSCFVFTSSIAVYGSNQVPFYETTVPNPEDPYGNSKFAVEQDLRAAHEMFGLDYIIFRPHNVYGPNQNIYDKYRNVVGIFMFSLLHKEKMRIFGDGLQTRSFSYIDDVAPYIAAAPLYPHTYREVFNIGVDKPYTLNELAVETGRIVSEGKTNAQINKDLVVHVEARQEVVNAEASHNKFQCYFKPKKTMPLGKGLTATYNWVKTNFDKQHPVDFQAVEIGRNIPPSWVKHMKVIHIAPRANIHGEQKEGSKRRLLELTIAPRSPEIGSSFVEAHANGCARICTDHMVEANVNMTLFLGFNENGTRRRLLPDHHFLVDYPSSVDEAGDYFKVRRDYDAERIYDVFVLGEARLKKKVVKALRGKRSNLRVSGELLIGKGLSRRVQQTKVVVNLGDINNRNLNTDLLDQVLVWKTPVVSQSSKDIEMDKLYGVKAGVTFKDVENIDAFTDAILDLVKNRKQREAVGEQGRSFVLMQGRDKRHVCRTFDKICRTVVQRGRLR